LKIIIGQPKLEQQLLQLEAELKQHPDADVMLFPEGYLNQNVEEASRLAAVYGTIIVSGHRRSDERPKDRSIIINKAGKIVLEKAKYTAAEVVKEQEWTISTLLCDELVLQGFRNENIGGVDVIMHSIGVGMFSEEQYTEWIEEARQMAIQNQCIVMGTSHADGSYRDSEISIPIAYCIAPDGQVVLASRNDTRTRLIVLDKRNTADLYLGVAGNDVSIQVAPSA
jgi:predicted amidohydrolase